MLNRSELAKSLDERRDRIMDVLERAAHEVGAELIAAKAEHPGRFMQWVADELPISLDKAQRLMAIARFTESTDPKVLASLPKGWTVLFELRKLPGDVLVRAVRDGDLDANTTREQAKEFAAKEMDPIRRLLTGSVEPPLHGKARATRKQLVEAGKLGAARVNRKPLADGLARELLRTDRADLSEPFATLLEAWLNG